MAPRAREDLGPRLTELEAVLDRIWSRAGCFELDHRENQMAGTNIWGVLCACLMLSRCMKEGMLEGWNSAVSVEIQQEDVLNKVDPFQLHSNDPEHPGA